MKSMRFAAVLIAVALLLAPAARAADTVAFGSIDATSASLWPLHIAIKNGCFAAANLQIVCCCRT
jgi:hypothetical protein